MSAVFLFFFYFQIKANTENLLINRVHKLWLFFGIVMCSYTFHIKNQNQNFNCITADEILYWKNNISLFVINVEIMFPMVKVSNN